MNNPKRMPLDQLRLTQEYTRLTAKQKDFVETYVGMGAMDGNYDAVNAVRHAYKCKNDEVARIMSYALLANINIVAVLNRHFAADPIDQFIQTLDRAVHNKKLTIAQLQALKLYCEVMGFGTKIAARENGETPQPAVIENQEVTEKKAPKNPRKPNVTPVARDLSTYANPADI